MFHVKQSIITRMENEIKAYSLEGIEQLVADAGLPSFRAGQIGQWLYAKGASSYSEMTNLPTTVREQFATAYPLHAPVLVESQTSADGTQKYLMKYHDGALAEAVAIPSHDGRLTVCCSSQSGCAMRCAFCATGHLGLTRSLLPGEILDQVLIANIAFGKRVTNVVVMGQGEPFANYENTLAALRIMNHPKLRNIGARHITISTCGLIPGIRRFAEEPEQFTLAVSLHSAIQETRDELMPACTTYPLESLRTEAIRYTEKTGRRISFEYALMKDVNDSEDHLNALRLYCEGLLCHVNLIPLNYIEGSPFKPAPTTVTNRWRDALEQAGVSATIRNSRGSDIAGACGQLAAKTR